MEREREREKSTWRSGTDRVFSFRVHQPGLHHVQWLTEDCSTPSLSISHTLLSSLSLCLVLSFSLYVSLSSLSLSLSLSFSLSLPCFLFSAGRGLTHVTVSMLIQYPFLPLVTVT